jgi:hypothetical protein
MAVLNILYPELAAAEQRFGQNNNISLPTITALPRQASIMSVGPG